MNKNLLIVGAGIYGVLAAEIAESIGCFERIDFVDDVAKQTPDARRVIGTTNDLAAISAGYGWAVVAIGNAKVRSMLVKKIQEETLLRLATLISPQAYVSPSAQIGEGSVVEPMAVVHTGSIVGKSCLICAGAVINHAAMVEDFVHVDCGAVVKGYCTVPSGMKVESGVVFENTASKNG